MAESTKAYVASRTKGGTGVYSEEERGRGKSLEDDSDFKLHELAVQRAHTSGLAGLSSHIQEGGLNKWWCSSRSLTSCYRSRSNPLSITTTGLNKKEKDPRRELTHNSVYYVSPARLQVRPGSAAEGNCANPQPHKPMLSLRCPPPSPSFIYLFIFAFATTIVPLCCGRLQPARACRQNLSVWWAWKMPCGPTA